MLVIADIAGQYDALMRLVARVPADEPIVLLGDLVDRGSDSDKVVQWAIDSAPRVRAVMGNHEHMMLDFYESTGIYDFNTWLSNGGFQTHYSYGCSRPPETHIDYLKSLPHYILENGYLFTHAPMNADWTLEQAKEFTANDPLKGSWNGSGGTLLWNRSEPRKREGYTQVFGHNSHWGLVKQDGWVCLDQSAKEVVTGLLTSTGEILEESY